MNIDLLPVPFKSSYCYSSDKILISHLAPKTRQRLTADLRSNPQETHKTQDLPKHNELITLETSPQKNEMNGVLGHDFAL